MTKDAEALEARNAEAKRQTFDQWMRDPLTRAALSMIPGGDHTDVLQALMRSAFDRGFAVGAGEVLRDFLAAAIDTNARRPGP